MSDSSSDLSVGEIVKILKGREKGNNAIILEVIDERYVLLVDGDKRKYDNPKKKNVHHIKKTNYISKEILDSLEENNRVSNAKIRYVLQDFISKRYSEDEERGVNHGQR